MKTVLITGGARGIGKGIAEAFLKQGYKVCIIYNKSRESAEKLAQRGVLIRRADVGRFDEVDFAVESLLAEAHHIDVLINNSGISQQTLFTDITPEMWERMIRTNLTGVFNCTKAVLPQMITNKSGRIINISSMWGQTGGSCEVHYSAAKAGVIGLTKALAKEEGLSGITVNCICPGVVMTDMMSGFSDSTLEELKAETPTGTLGTPGDIANACLFLADDKSSFITGQVLGVNGGIVI